MKKFLLFMLGVLVALPGLARDFTYEYEGQTLTYTVIDEDAKTCQTKEGEYNRWVERFLPGNHVGGVLVIPSIAKDGDVEYTVTTIGNYAFCDCSSLTSVFIPNSVTTIGGSAFAGCFGLIKSAYPDNLNNPFPYNWEDPESGLVIRYPANESIIEDGFVYGSEKTVIYFAPLSLEGEYIIPNSVTTIGESAFACCSGLTSVDIPNSVTTIGNYAFCGCSSLTSVDIPNSVTTIGNYAFSWCSSLTSITVSNITPPAMYGDSFDGLYALATLSVPDDAICDYLATIWSWFKNLKGLESDVALQTYETGNLKYRLVPAAIEGGKNSAIVVRGNYSSLTEVTIPERFTVSENGADTRYYVDGIGYKAFNECSNLNTVTFNSKNASKMIGDYAFAGTGIEAISIPRTVETIGDYAFSECSGITEVTIPGSVKTIGDYAFYNMSDLGTVVLNEGLETIGESAFSQSSNRDVSSIYIPSTVKSIGKSAFDNFTCSEVNISDITAWCGIDFADYTANPLHNSKKLYLNDERVTELNIPGGVTEIKPYAFYYCAALNSVTFNEELQSIGNGAFCDCSALESVTFNSGLQSIGERAFCRVGKLETITIPGTVNYIGEYAFAASASTLTFEYGNSPVELAVKSFNAPTSLSWDRPAEGLNFDLSSLENLAIGNSVDEIPAGKFKGADRLKSLTLGSGLKTIGDEAFSGCTALTEVIVPPSVESIGASAFSGNTGLTSIIMGHNVKTIGENAFYQCPAQTVSITAQTPPTAPDNTFSNYTGNLYVQGQTAADAYYDADYCWYQFEGHVMIEPTELKVDGNGKIEGKPGDTFQLTATLYPEGVTLPQIFWRSTNPEIATVDANGLVTLHANLSEVMAAAEGDDTSDICKIIAESLYADGPVAEWTVNNDVETGIDDVISDGNVTGDIDFNAPVEVYNMQGVMVGRSMDNLATGIYIVRQNNLVKKIAVN